jgi:NAD(P)-dependent dehydrogenase (short-subunit alcohol dehydrogenase family)
VRGARQTGLDDLAKSSAGRLVVESVDITVPEQVAALHDRLAQETFDLLFVNAGITDDSEETVADVSTDTFVRLMVTNALSPMRVVETLQDLVAPHGTIGVMSSGQGSIANNTKGGFEVYRASKSALNQLMRSFAARHSGDPRTLLLIAPGWVQTDLGGPAAPLAIGQSIPRRGRHDRDPGRPGRTAVPGLSGQDRRLVTQAQRCAPLASFGSASGYVAASRRTMSPGATKVASWRGLRLITGTRS